MLLPPLFLIVLIGAALAYYRIGVSEGIHPFILSFISVAVSFISPTFIPLPGFIAAVIGQVILFIGLTVYKAATGAA